MVTMLLEVDITVYCPRRLLNCVRRRMNQRWSKRHVLKPRRWTIDDRRWTMDDRRWTICLFLIDRLKFVTQSIVHFSEFFRVSFLPRNVT